MTLMPPWKPVPQEMSSFYSAIILFSLLCSVRRSFLMIFLSDQERTGKDWFYQCIEQLISKSRKVSLRIFLESIKKKCISLINNKVFTM